MDCAIKELAEGEVFHHVAILEGLKRLFQTESPLFYIYIINTFPLYKKKDFWEVENKSDSLAWACLNSAFNFFP